MSETTKYTVKELMDWCDAKVDAGQELVIKWEGGKHPLLYK